MGARGFHARIAFDIGTQRSLPQFRLPRRNYPLPCRPKAMPGDFPYDVFLSHSSKDKAVVRPLAERLRKDGLKVWFDEWEIKAGDSIPAKIEEGLEQSRVLVL